MEKDNINDGNDVKNGFNAMMHKFSGLFFNNDYLK